MSEARRPVGMTMKRLPLLTESRMRCWRRCRREHHYRYELGYTTRASAAQDLGTLLHVGLERWWLAHKDGQPEHALEAAFTALDDVADPYDRARVEALLIGYDARWADAGYEVLAVEAEFRAQLPGDHGTPVAGHLPKDLLRHVEDFRRNGRWGRCGFCAEDPAACEFTDRYDHHLTQARIDEILGYQLRTAMIRPGAPFLLAGKLDVIARDPAGRVVIIEHKSTSEDATLGSPYWARLRLDGQISTYHRGARALGYEVEAVVYDVVVKPGLRPQRATPPESRKWTQGKRKKCQRCRPPTPACLSCGGEGSIEVEPPRLYAGQRLTDETPAEFRARSVEELASAPDRYYVRGEVVRLEAELARYDLELVAEARRIAQGGAERNPDACVRFGSTCGFFPVCTGEKQIEEYTRLSFPHPELTEDLTHGA